jgi:hypothetical protein
LRYFLVIVVVAAVISQVGCGPKTSPGTEITDGVGKNWEIAWVDPQIVSSDQFHTLIYATRIDSMRIAGLEPRVAPGAVFHLQTDTCLVTIDLLDQTGRIVMPMLVRRLPIGWYKFTVTPSAPKDYDLPPGPYVVEIGYCGQVGRTPVVLQ